MAAPETRALAWIELEPAADEFLDLDARLEIAREKRAQARDALDPRGEQSGIGQLGEIGDRVGVAKRRRSDADHRADIGAEPVLVGPIVLGDRTRVRPGAKEQRQETALEDVDETRKRVVPFEKPIVRFFGRGQGQGALRAEHAQEAGLETHAPVRVDRRGFEVRVGEFEIGVLRDLDEFVLEPARLANARFGRILPFEAPQNAEQIEAPRLGLKLRAEGHSRPLKPRRGGQRIISPRSTVRTIVWVKWLIAIYSAKKRSRTAPSRNAPEPSNALPSRVERYLKPARRGCARRLTQPPHGRACRQAAHAPNLGVGRGVGKIGEQNERLAKRLGAVVGPVSEPQMIEAQHADEAPGDLAGRRVQPSSLDRGERRLERFGRTADAAKLELRVVEEAEVGAALAHRKMRGEMPVGAERVDAELGDAQSFVRVRAFAKRQKDVRADVIGNRPVFPFVRGASPGQAANCVGEAGRAASRPRGIERLDGKLLRRARHVGEHPNDAIGLEIERAAPVGNDRKFELVGLDGNPVQPLLEEIGARRRIEREHLLAHRRGQLRIHVVEGEDDVDRLGVEARGDARRDR